MCSNESVSAEVTSSFPNPAQDYYHGPVSLDRQFIAHPSTTFFMRVHGDALRSRGILQGDTLIVDRSLTASPGCVIIVVIDEAHRLGAFTTVNGYAYLTTDEGHEPLTNHMRLWGVVTACVHHLAPPS